MKIKSCFKVFGIICCILALAACSKANPETAIWEGYEDMPFAEFLEEGFTAMVEENDADVECEVEIRKDWKLAEDLDDLELDEADLGEGKMAVAYVLNCKISDGNESETGEVVFFAELDKDENTLEIVGAFSSADDSEYVDDISAEEAENALEELAEYL